MAHAIVATDWNDDHIIVWLVGGGYIAAGWTTDPPHDVVDWALYDTDNDVYDQGSFPGPLTPEAVVSEANNISHT